MFQAGLRPAVSRLYDPFDAMLARRGSVKKDGADSGGTPGLGAAALRSVLRRPGAINELLDGPFGSKMLGGSLVVLIFEGEGDAPAARHGARARALRDDAREVRGRGPGAQVAAAPLLGELPPGAGVRRGALLRHDGGRGAVVEAARALRRRAARARRARVRDGAPEPRVPRRLLHLLLVRGHGGQAQGRPSGAGWDERCEITYDRAWKAAIAAAIEAGGTLAHHHGVGRSKAPRMAHELGAGGIDVGARAHARVRSQGHLEPRQPAAAADAGAVRRRRAPRRQVSA